MFESCESYDMNSIVIDNAVVLEWFELLLWNHNRGRTCGNIRIIPHHWSRIAWGRLHLPLMFQSQLKRGFCATSTTQWDSQLRIQDTNTEKTASVAMQPKRSRCIWLVSSNSICSFPHLRGSSSLMRAFARRRTQLIGYIGYCDCIGVGNCLRTNASAHAQDSEETQDSHTNPRCVLCEFIPAIVTENRSRDGSVNLLLRKLIGCLRSMLSVSLWVIIWIIWMKNHWISVCGSMPVYQSISL